MRLSPVDAPVVRPLSMSLGTPRQSTTSSPAEHADETDKASVLAAEFARARAEGYSAGMDDAALELDEQKAALERDADRQRKELIELQKEARQHASEALHGLQQAIAQAASLVEPAALELAMLIVEKVLGKRIETHALARDVIHAAAAVAAMPPLNIRVGTGLAEQSSEMQAPVVVDASLGVFECVVESARGGACISPARRLRAIVDSLLARLEARGG
jgi:flagellar biosynthesis/type III secretory pathway protein FliH